MAHPADKFITRTDGPFAIARGCKLCHFHVVTKKPPPGSRGRGWGMREGNIQRGKLIQHIKQMHPEALS